MEASQAAMAPISKFDPRSEKWTSYLVRFRQFLRGNNFQDLSDERKRALFLAHCGSEVLEMAIDLVSPRNIEEMSWADLQEVLKEHYAPTGTPIANRFNFQQRNQLEGESIKDFVAALRQIASNCEFDNVENALRDRIVFGMRDMGLQRKFLSRKKIPLKDVVEESIAAEISEKAAAAMSRAKGVHKLHRQPKSSTDDSSASSSDDEMAVHKVSRHNQKKRAQDGDRSERCGSCKGNHPRTKCRWRDAICRRCNKRGHIAEACRAEEPAQEPIYRSKSENRYGNQRASKRSSARPPQHSGGDATSQTSGIHTIDDRATKFFATVIIEGNPCPMEVDSGSNYSIMDWHTIKSLKPSLRKEDLKPMRVRLVDFGGNPVGILGRTSIEVAYHEFRGQLPVTIVERSRPSLLGMEWFQPLGLSISGIHQIGRDELDTIIGEFKEVFDGKLGKFVGKPISFNLDKAITPIRLKPRRVPFALRPKVDAQIDKLVAQGVLEPVDHAAWETPIVTPLKHDGSVRICADYKCSINLALQQSAYPVPVVQHLLHSLGHGTIFAKLDLAQAYQQLPVDDKTAEAQTIVTHRGAFKCTRLQFGVSAAPGIFQSFMERLLQGIPGVVPYFDDVLISGLSKTQLLERLRSVLQRFKEKGLRVRRDKCIIGVQEVEFLGYLIDGNGIHPTKSKVRAIHEAPAPKNKSELQAFLGLLNFYSVFLKQKATAAEPLHRLLGKAAAWKWGKEEDAAFRAVKKLLSSDSVLIQYHETLPLLLTCDASPYGIGAVLSHQLPDGKEAPIAYFSKTLSSAERNYGQLDKEALAIVAGVKRFHEYLYGRRFTVITDHKPLLGLLSGSKPTPSYTSPRMTRWAIFLAGYSYELCYKPGTCISNADALSRCPLTDLVEDPAPTLGLHHIDNDLNCPVSSADVAAHTRKDRTLRQVLSWVLRGWPNGQLDSSFLPFTRKQQELSVMRGCLLWGDRVVVPQALQKRTLKTLHNGHPGIVRMKGLARSYVWWPSMDRDIEEWVSRCDPCQEVRPAPPQAPVTEWETPSNPWARIHIDFAGPMQGKFLLIVVDAFSKWLEVIPLASITTEVTIKALRHLFATHGLPDVLVSDNGPQLTSKAMEEFLAGLGIRHALSAPYRPAGNGQAERMVRLTKEALARMGPGDWQEKIDTFLLLQHITPHAKTRKCPSELLMGRRLRSTLDRLHPQYDAEVNPTASHPLRSFAPGDSIFALNFHGQPKWLKGTVSNTTGPKSYLIELFDGTVCRRHLDQLRKRWGEATENQPEEVALQHPSEAALQHPDEVGLQHTCREGRQHPYQADQKHRCEAALQHPGEADLPYPGKAVSHHPYQVGSRHPDENRLFQPEGDGGVVTRDRCHCQVDQYPRTAVDRDLSSKGTPKHVGAQDFLSATERDHGLLTRPGKQQPHQAGQHHPGKVDPGQQPGEVGQRYPRRGGQPTQPAHGQLTFTNSARKNVHLPVSSRSAPRGSEVQRRGDRRPGQEEDKSNQRYKSRARTGGVTATSPHSTAAPQPSDQAGGAETDPTPPSAESRTPTGKEPEEPGTACIQSGGEAQTEMRRSTRTTKRPAYLSDYELS